MFLLCCFQPLEIFENKCLFCVDLFSLCGWSLVWNFNLFDIELLLILFLLCLCFVGLLFINVIRSFFFMMVLMVCDFIKDLIMDQTSMLGRFFLVFILSIFFTIFFSNILGLVPLSFCVTSQFMVTFLLSFSVFIGLTLYGFLIQGFKFLNIFVPKNVPVVLLPFLVLIEVISYISRTFSLSIRLFANMVAGHALLHILISAFVLAVKSFDMVFFIFLMILPFMIIFSIVLLETGIAFLQAYVFVVLISIYMVDSLGLSSH